MKGLALSKAFFQAYGMPMLETEFPDVMERIAAGLVGHGSECYGFDDETSQDHDFEPGFHLWIDDADEKEFGFKLFRAYRNLPKEYLGHVQKPHSLGRDSLGVHTIRAFYSFYTGTGDVPQTLSHWLSIPEFTLAEATNGEVFFDPSGRFSLIRQRLLEERPEDVRLKKLASGLFYMAQAGQYNYERCIGHGEKAAAAVALAEFAKNAAEVVYLLNNRYAPYYKWIFRGMRELPLLGETGEALTALLASPYAVEENRILIEKTAAKVISFLQEQDLCMDMGDYLEPYAYGVLGRIRDAGLRNSEVML